MAAAAEQPPGIASLAAANRKNVFKHRVTLVRSIKRRREKKKEKKLPTGIT